MKTGEFVTDIAINSKGLRDREYAHLKPQGTRRILCLGDSFTFGYGVQADETFAKVLERAFAADSMDDGAWEVINAGVPGTGTAYQLAYLQLEGHNYDPDFVLLSFCGKNDFTDNARSGLYSLREGRLIRQAVRLSTTGEARRLLEKIPGYRALLTRSRLLMFVGRRMTAWLHSRRVAGPVDPEADGAEKKEAYRLAESLILGLRDSCQASGCELVMTVAPEIDRGDQREEGVVFADLRPAFDACGESPAACFYAVDHHWNRLGHEVAGRALHDFFLGIAEPSR
jgi:hypothetical protein